MSEQVEQATAAPGEVRNVKPPEPKKVRCPVCGCLVNVDADA